MRKVTETMAGKWFLNDDNKYKLYTGTIPKKVILSLAKLSNEELYSLSQEICWNSYWKRFHSLALETNRYTEEENIEIEEDAFEKYLADYQKEYFGCFDHEEEMVKEVSNKLKALLDTLIFWAEGFFIIQNHFDLFDTAESRVMIDISSSILKRNKINDLTKKKQLQDNNIDVEEKSSFDLIYEALRNNDVTTARAISDKVKKIQERLG